ncbi:MAG: hypothetical protein KA792_07540 [Bacteroidales bacterium]|nr:hypothetical protein [Bacteroidales bacterium]
MGIILSFIYTLIFIYIIYKLPFYKVEGFYKKHIIYIFLLKISAGFLLYLIYTYYYTDRKTADIFRYFDDSQILHNALFSKPLDYIQMLTGIGNDSEYFNIYYKAMNNWFRIYESNIYNDSHTIIRFNAFVRLFSFGHYSVHTIFICFLSLTGLVALYKFLAEYFINKKTLLFIGVFLMPSVVFWGSGVLKEGLLLFAMGMLLYGIKNIYYKQFNWFQICLTICSLILLFFIKFYILLTLIPLILSYFITLKAGKKYTEIIYFSVLTIFGLIAFNIHYIFPGYNFLEILVNKQKDFINLAIYMNSGSLIESSFLKADFISLLYNCPKAFLTTLFRPFLFESFSPFYLLAGFENFLLIILGLSSIFFIKIKEINRNILYFSLFFVLITFTLTGLITPVLGSIVRYKIPALPYLVVLFGSLININKISAIKNLTFKQKDKV